VKSGELTTLPRLPSWFKEGPTTKGKERGREGRGREGRERKRKGSEGIGEKGSP